MSGAPRVTVGLPTFNGERYLAEAIASTLAQDFGDFELIIADNASTDASRDIVRDVAGRDRRVRLLTSDRNRGAAWNFNRLLAEARGDLFTWSADDDTYEPEYLSRCVGVLDRRPDVVLCFAQAVEIDAEGAVIERRGPTNVADLPNAWARYRAILLDEVYCYAAFGVIRTDCLRRTGLIGSFAQSDRVLLAELALHGRFVECPEALYRHREHPGRSMYAFRDDRDRLRWFDTSLDGSRTLPRWRLGAEFARALHRASPQLAADERVRSSLTLLPWGAANRRTLVREAVRTALVRSRDLVPSR